MITQSPDETPAVQLPEDDGSDDGVSRDLTYAVAEASATHPEDTPLDDNGDPIPE